MGVPPRIDPAGKADTVDRNAAAAMAVLLGLAAAASDAGGYRMLTVVAAALAVTLQMVALALWLLPLTAERRTRTALGLAQPAGRSGRWWRRGDAARSHDSLDPPTNTDGSDFLIELSSGRSRAGDVASFSSPGR